MQEEKSIDYAKIAYDTYCSVRSWKSVKGEALPQFEQQSEELREAWKKAVLAVLAVYEGEIIGRLKNLARDV